MSKSIELKIKFRTRVGVKLPTLRSNEVTENEVTLRSLVTSDFCKKKKKNEGFNQQARVVVVTHKEKVWLPINTKLSEGRIDTFNSFIVGNPKYEFHAFQMRHNIEYVTKKCLLAKIMNC